jgi:hypothetical protein
LIGSVVVINRKKQGNPLTKWCTVQVANLTAFIRPRAIIVRELKRHAKYDSNKKSITETSPSGPKVPTNAINVHGSREIARSGLSLRVGVAMAVSCLDFL